MEAGATVSRESRRLPSTCEFPITTPHSANGSGHFKTGVLPLEIKADGKGLAKNMSEDLPPISDIEAMFAHLSSRVRIPTRANGYANHLAPGHCQSSRKAQRSQAACGDDVLVSCNHILSVALLTSQRHRVPFASPWDDR